MDTLAGAADGLRAAAARRQRQRHGIICPESMDYWARCFHKWSDDQISARL
jgi:hypothetical protein